MLHHYDDMSPEEKYQEVYNQYLKDTYENMPLGFGGGYERAEESAKKKYQDFLERQKEIDEY